MTITVRNTEEAALDFCADVLDEYLEARLIEVGAAFGMTLPKHDLLQRGILEPNATSMVGIGIRSSQTSKELRHSMQKAVFDVTAKLGVAGGALGLETGVEVSRALALYTDAIGFVLQKYVRGGRDGVYHCEENRKAPPRELVGQDKFGNWGGTRECTVRVFQQQPIV